MRKSSSSSGAPRAVAEGILAVHEGRAVACALLFVSPAQLWAPDVVSTAQSEVRITFSPDGKRMLWGAIGWSSGPASTGGGWDIYESEHVGGGWGYGLFLYDTASHAFKPDGTGANCGAACHTIVKSKDYVFTRYEKK
jgi:hypothetical protein